ncbi:hypothetical protein [Chitinophaga sp. XS-30]|nr:hypothetical protein [Chitinophaga sp. XS-30]
MIVAQRKGKHHEMAFEIGKTNDRKGKMYRATWEETGKRNVTARLAEQ